MSNCYSMDLRKRVVDAYLKQEGSMAQLALRFQIHSKTVSKWIKLYQTQGHVAPKAAGGGHRSVIQEPHRSFFESLYQQSPDLEHRDACRKFQEKFGVLPSESALSRGLKRLGISRKKKRSLIRKKTKILNE